MDFFDEDFNIRFMYKHGKQVYSDICKMIVQENSSNWNYKYIEIIFRIALFDFAGQQPKVIKGILEDAMNCKIDIKQIMTIHKKSISEIQKYLQSSYNQTLENEK